MRKGWVTLELSYPEGSRSRVAGRRDHERREGYLRGDEILVGGPLKAMVFEFRDGVVSLVLDETTIPESGSGDRVSRILRDHGWVVRLRDDVPGRKDRKRELAKGLAQKTSAS